MKAVGWFLLNLLQAIFLCVWSMLCVCIALIVALFSRDAALRMAPRVWAPPLMRIGGVRIETELHPGIDWSKPHIFVMNHQSMLDIPVAFIALPVPLRFIAKKVLGSIPFLGWYMRATQMILIDRERSAQAIASIQQAGQRIREGANIIAFPEGTRSRDGRIRPFKKGIFVVAIEAGVPIVPVAIHGASDILCRDSFRVRPGLVRVKVGAPIPTEGLEKQDRDRLLQQVHREVVALHLAIGGPGSETVLPLPPTEAAAAAEKPAVEAG